MYQQFIAHWVQFTFSPQEALKILEHVFKDPVNYSDVIPKMIVQVEYLGHRVANKFRCLSNIEIGDILKK